jgi:hypothetical protein
VNPLSANPLIFQIFKSTKGYSANNLEVGVG